MRTDQSSGRQRCQGFKEVGVALYVPLCVSVHVGGGGAKSRKGLAGQTTLPFPRSALTWLCTTHGRKVILLFQE